MDYLNNTARYHCSTCGNGGTACFDISYTRSYHQMTRSCDKRGTGMTILRWPQVPSGNLVVSNSLCIIQVLRKLSYVCTDTLMSAD